LINTKDLKSKLEELGVEFVDKHDFSRLIEVNDLLEHGDGEFVPTLSSVKPIKEHVTEYLRDEEAIFIKNENGKMISIAFFLLKGKDLHIDGIVTLKNYRNNKYAQLLYKSLELIAEDMQAKRLTLTTWSENYAQLHILNKMGYECELREERLPGINTVFLSKKISCEDIQF
jgi:ribosomal protein S18 acetylase RimI-like enzyme